MKRVCMIGATISGNKGAESMFRSAVQNIGREIPDSLFYLFSYYPSRDRKINEYSNVIICSGTPFKLTLIYPLFGFICMLLPFLKNIFGKIDKDFLALSESDLIIDLAGISFVDGREKYLVFNIACIIFPVLFRKKVIKYSQALGPFNNRLNRFLARIFLPRIDCIIARGEITYNNLRSIGLDKTIIGADSAFSMEISKSSYKTAEGYLHPDFREKVLVGISPSSVIDNSCRKMGVNYSSIMTDFINYLIEEKEYRVAIIPHSILKYSMKSKNNDLLVSRKIHDAVNNKGSCLLIADELNAEILRVLISYCDYFVASRFHAMVSSLSMRVPTIVCGWSHKYLEVLTMFKMEDYAFDYKNLNKKMLTDRFEMLENDQNAIKEKYEQFLPQVVISARNNHMAAKNLLES